MADPYTDQQLAEAKRQEALAQQEVARLAHQKAEEEQKAADEAARAANM